MITVLSEFRISSVESLPTEACDSTMELKRKKTGLRFLYRLKSNSKFTKSLNTLNDKKDQNCRKRRINQTKWSTPKKTGTNIYKRTERVQR